MRLRIASALLASLALSTLATAQIKGEGGGEGDPCGNVSTSPTVGKCWDCFKKLLTDCDTSNNTADRRQACYTGANTFLTWCLGQLTPPPPPHPQPKPKTKAWPAGQTLQYNVPMPIAYPAGSFTVAGRKVNGDPLTIDANASPDPLNPLELVITVAWTPALAGQPHVGIVVRADEAGTLEWGNAQVARIDRPADFNQDGYVNAQDMVAATNALAGGTITLTQFNTWLETFKTSPR